MKITLEVEYDIGQIVYSKTDKEQEPRIVIGYSVRPSSLLVYDVQCADKVNSYYDFELTSEVDTLLKTQ